MTSDRDGGGDERPGRTTSDEDAALARRLRDLQGKLQQRHVEGEGASGPGAGGGVGGMGQALKLGSEFVAAVLVGFGIGWLLDQGLGTKPWGLIVFVLLGFCAGVLNVMRSAGVIKTTTLPRDSDPSS